jgi:hypothetical protein
MTFPEIYAKHGPGYYRTRDGRKALVGEWHSEFQRYVGVVMSDLEVTFATWSAQGICNGSTVARLVENVDLVDVWTEPRKISGWVASYASHRPRGLYDTKEDALQMAVKIATFSGPDVYEKPTAAIFVTGVEGVGPEESGSG